MHDVLARGGVIGGSSAGASIQGSYMARGNPLGNRDSMAEGYEIGLGFLTGVAIDQHFTQRNRLPDMTALVDTYPELLGIGLDEASSIIVQGTVAEVFSRPGRNALFYDRRVPVAPGKLDHLVVKHGQQYDLKARRLVEPSPKKQ
jgi:cyanophycinase-like exopeptidase